MPESPDDAACPCLCHSDHPGIEHVRACCPRWDGPLGGHVGESLPHIEARIRRQYEDLLGSIWLYIGWRYVTKQLTTEQKNLFADAVAADLARGDGFAPGEVEAAVDRWWIKDRPSGESHA